MIALRQLLLPARRTFVIRTNLGPPEVEARLATSIERPRLLATPSPGHIMGKVSAGHLEAYVAGGRNSFRPIMRARIEPDMSGGSVLRATIAVSRWVTVFMLVWLAGALTLSGILVVASIVGFVTGTALMRDGSGHPMAPAAALIVSVGAFVLFGGAGLLLPLLGRRITATDPDRLVAFLVLATDGAVEDPQRAGSLDS